MDWMDLEQWNGKSQGPRMVPEPLDEHLRGWDAGSTVDF
jgi:hypothetical protein